MRYRNSTDTKIMIEKQLQYSKEQLSDLLRISQTHGEDRELYASIAWREGEIAGLRLALNVITKNNFIDYN